MKKKRTLMEFTKAERDVLPTVYAVCKTCGGWAMVAAILPDDNKADQRWTNDAIARHVRLGNEVKHTTAAGFRAPPITSCKCGRKAEEAVKEAVIQEALI